MNNKIVFNIFKNILFLALLLISFSGRSFTGLTFFDYRLGELIVGGLFVVSLILLFVNNKNYKSLQNSFKFLIAVFIFSSVIVKQPIFTEYIIKSSSYIWMASLIFVSLLLSNFLPKDSWFFIVYMLLPFILFFTETVNYPDFLQEFFFRYSDKFDFLKGSDLALVIISAQIIAIIKLKKQHHIFTYFIFVNSLYLPFLLYKSKGAFLGAFIFFTFIFFTNITFVYKNLKNFITLLLGVLIFMISTNHVSQLNLYGEDTASSYVEKTTSNLESIVESKNTSMIFSSFYIQDGRLYSTENNANWRLEIWQDVIFNLNKNNLLLTGYGYSSIIPEMELPHRQGSDGSNENVHNFIINILARGGVISLIPFFLFMYLIVQISKKDSKNYLIFMYILSVLAISFFDATNESVRYPFIFYTFLGYFLNNLDKTYKFKLSKQIY